jgi:NDP-sugar pyrophosphorylase family protein
MLPALVLCGGLGTRLRSVVADRPKALALVNDEPFLGHVLYYLARQGCREVVLSTGYLGEMIEDYAGTGSRWGVRVQYAREPEPLGTGGAIRFAAERAGLTSSFFVLNGDTFFSGSLERLSSFHQSKGNACATIALVEVPSAERYGAVQRDEASGAVTAFQEKQEGLHQGLNLINAGVYVVEPELVESIPVGRNVSLERDVFPRWIGWGLYGKVFPDAAFLDIGTPEDYARAAELLNGK